MSNPDEYKQSAINSFRLAVELFNRPFDQGRVEATLIHLNHSFEMLLKGAILQNGGVIRDDDGDGNTISFEKCVNICRYGDRDAGDDLIVLSKTEGAVLLTINQQRDFVEHEQVQINEQQLFLEARQAVDIFQRILEEVFDDSLANHIPDRILPLATLMPVDIINVIENEITEIREYIRAGNEEKARKKIKAIESIERGIDDEGGTPTRSQVDDLLNTLEQEDELADVFPSVFSALTDGVSTGGGRRLQLGSDEGIEATYIPEDEIDDDSDVYFFTEKNLHDRYPLYPTNLAEEVNEQLDEEITRARLRAVLNEMGILDDRNLYRSDISLGKGSKSRAGYRPVVVKKAVDAIESGAIDPEEAWDKHGDEVWPG